jgi:hypothetical protein
MSYQQSEIEQATKKCQELKSRGGGVINADAIANNPDCQTEKKTKKQRRRRILIPTLTTFVVVGVAVGFWYFTRPKK